MNIIQRAIMMAKEITYAMNMAIKHRRLGILVHLATKKPLREITYPAAEYHRPGAGLDMTAVVAWEFSKGHVSKIVVPLLVQSVDGDCADRQLRAELRRLRRAALSLGMDVRAVLVGDEGIVGEWK